MISRLRISSSFVAIVLLAVGCNKAPEAELFLQRFWRDRPANGNPLELAGYDRSFAMTSPPGLIDAMIADLKSSNSGERFGTYTIVAYYLPRPASFARLTKLQQSSTDSTRQWADRFLQRFGELDNEAAMHRPEHVR